MTVIVVPCYNEANRLNARAFENVPGEASCLFVDDGSTDATRSLIDQVCAGGAHQSLLLPDNVGKAEAVRRGLLEAIETGATRVGYWDADLATPLDEIPRFIEILDTHPDVDLVLGARINLLGRKIHRSNARHYLGRTFATAVSSLLNLHVYDTQCGAKLFRVSDDLRAILDEPFMSRWIFDVEILARWLTLPDRSGLHSGIRSERIYELPLKTWRDIAGSKLGPLDLLRAPYELLRIHTRYFGSH
jgi:glycosyltransferase involved in cell wall biosynthesis